jgi:cbb3-type cytochrome oxidase subunit 3
MSAGELGYLAFGAALVVLFGAIVRHYYARGRRAKIEKAKYEMLEDDDEQSSSRNLRT